MLVAELDTPAVIIDLDMVERNLRRMADYCREHGFKLRPHAKTHKVPELAHQQMTSGAVGITVAKLGEAEVMIEAGISDLLIAYPIVGEQKTKRLAALAERARLAVSLDSTEAAQAISEQAQERGVKIGVLVEIDVGFRRCGVENEQAALALARRILDLPGLEFRGLMFFPGNFVLPLPQQAELREQANARLARMLEAFERASIPVPIISGGSTPTAYSGHLFRGVNEIRPGIYIFNDRNMAGLGVAAVEDCALAVAVTVVSTGVAGRAIIDGGSKTFSSDRYLAGDGRGFGLVKEDPEAELEVMTEEHGHLNISRSSRRYRIGERLTIIPNHVCSAVNMHDEVYGVRGERVEAVWRVAARGKIR
jgi:D-serine deaminase-like pyridoxal phosphate-dependent protein